MKEWMALLLACLLCTGSAVADTTYTACTAEAYRDQMRYIPGGEEPFRLAQYRDGNMENWDILWTDDAGERMYGYYGLWFPARGIAAEASCDMDGDGVDERVVLLARDAVTEGAAELVLQVYEGEVLADEALLCGDWDIYSVYTHVFLMEMADGRPVVAYQNCFGVESFTQTIWLLDYDGQLGVCGGLLRASDEVGNWDNIRYAASGCLDLLEYDVDISEDYENHSNPAEYAWGAACTDLEQDSFERDTLDSMAAELGLEIDWTAQEFREGFCLALDAENGSAQTLLQVNMFARDADGTPVLRIRRRTAQ